MSNAKGRKWESCNIKKDGKGRLAQGEDEVRRIWNEYFEDADDLVLCGESEEDLGAMVGWSAEVCSKR